MERIVSYCSQTKMENNMWMRNPGTHNCIRNVLKNDYAQNRLQDMIHSDIYEPKLVQRKK